MFTLEMNLKHSTVLMIPIQMDFFNEWVLQSREHSLHLFVWPFFMCNLLKSTESLLSVCTGRQSSIKEQSLFFPCKAVIILNFQELVANPHEWFKSDVCICSDHKAKWAILMPKEENERGSERVWSGKIWSIFCQTFTLEFNLHTLKQLPQTNILQIFWDYNSSNSQSEEYQSQHIWRDPEKGQHQLETSLN